MAHYLLKRGLCSNKLWSTLSNTAIDQILPLSCNVLVCGGGIAGLSLAYQLAALDRLTDIVVVDQRSFGSGVTNRGLGYITGIRSTPLEGKLSSLTLKTIKELSEKYDIGLQRNGSLYLAQCSNRLVQLKRLSSLYGRLFQCELVGKSDVERLHPYLQRDDLAGAMYVPGDVVVDPSALVNALITDLQSKGVTLVENCAVTGMENIGRRVVAAHTSLGRIECNNFVNAAGSWASELGAQSMPIVRVAQHPCTQLIYTSQPLSELSQGKVNLPVVRDYDSSMYFHIRPEDSAVVLSGFEEIGQPISDTKAIPASKTSLKMHSHPAGTVDSTSFGGSSWDRLTPFLGSALNRLPLLSMSSVGHLGSVVESYTPDGAWILGKTPKLDNYWVCCAGNSSGFSASFGMGHVLASWILDGFPPIEYDVWPIDTQRFLPFHSNAHFLRERLKEAVSLQSWPYLLSDAPSKLRPMRTTPLYTYQLQQGAFFFAQNSFERPQYFDPTITVHDHIKPTYRR